MQTKQNVRVTDVKKCQLFHCEEHEGFEDIAVVTLCFS
jgi:anti-sigma factor ChrR (cupin superfamily)